MGGRALGAVLGALVAGIPRAWRVARDPSDVLAPPVAPRGGGYGDRKVPGEGCRAAAALLATTGDEEYRPLVTSVPEWQGRGIPAGFDWNAALVWVSAWLSDHAR